MDLKFQNSRSLHDVTYDKLAAAMETGNPSGAREVLADLVAEHPALVEGLKAEILRDYNIAL